MLVIQIGHTVYAIAQLAIYMLSTFNVIIHGANFDDAVWINDQRYRCFLRLMNSV